MTYTTLRAYLQFNSDSKQNQSKTFQEFSVQTSPISKNTHCDALIKNIMWL